MKARVYLDLANCLIQLNNKLIGDKNYILLGGKRMGFWESLLAGKASKEVTEKLWKCDNGVLAYKYAAKIFILCGVVWAIMGAVAAYFSSVYWLLNVALINFLPGLILLILCSNSKKFCEWANKDFMKSKKRYEMPSKKRDAIAIIISVISMVILFGILFLASVFEGE